MSSFVNTSKFFPDPRDTDENGLVAVGGEFGIELLEDAYANGIFPWPQTDEEQEIPLLWFSPVDRGVLEFKDFHVPKNVAKVIRQQTYEVTIDHAFEQVMRECAQAKRLDQSGTWILDEMIETYMAWHKKGGTHSVEAWQDGTLVGGLYGVDVQGVFAGESMFYKKNDASKVCLVHLVEFLKTLGREWIDIQMVTPLLEQFGGKYLSRESYLDLLVIAQKDQKKWSSA